MLGVVRGDGREREGGGERIRVGFRYVVCIIEGQEYLHHTPLLHLVPFSHISMNELKETCALGK